MAKRNSPTESGDELPFEVNFIEQAEYIDSDRFAELTIEHPEEESILRKLMGGGAKLLIGPRGCGKSTLMLKAFHQMLNAVGPQALPVYVNFKLALKVEPLYSKGANAPFWFKGWLTLKVIEALRITLEKIEGIDIPDSFPKKDFIEKTLVKIEAGTTDGAEIDNFSITFLQRTIHDILERNDINRCVLLIDDAAHAFSEKQQEDFFDFFRAVKSKSISPKAAVYPGITSHSPSFQVGHDAEQIDVWVKPYGEDYEEFMLELARKRFQGTQINLVDENIEDIAFLAYCSFGIPRAFLGMLRAIYNSPESYFNTDGSLSKSKVLTLSRSGKEMSHGVYSSLEAKLPSLKSYVENGAFIYRALLDSIKDFNQGKERAEQTMQFGIRSPLDPNLEKVVSFYQYAGLIMPIGEFSRGENGVFLVFEFHIGDLVTDNAIVGRRTKSIAMFLEVLRAKKHSAWPRTVSSKILEATKLTGSDFKISLPQCQVCGKERPTPEAHFCHHCGSRLKSSSAYEYLADQDISVLDISNTIKERIKKNSQIRKVRDILIDSSREQLMAIKYIKKARAVKIVGAAEEYVS
jgi:energy-coupling factor transporter ATP-binding protein EcfA2